MKRTKLEALEQLKVLSSGQRELAEAVALGLTNQEIADKLGFAEKTIRNRVGEIFQILELKNRVQLALLVWQAQQ